MMPSQDYDLKNEMVWIEFTTVNLDVTVQDFVHLLDLQAQVAKFDISATSDPSQDSTSDATSSSKPVSNQSISMAGSNDLLKTIVLPPTVVVAFTSVELNLLKSSTCEYSVKCAVNDFILCSEPNSDPSSSPEQYGEVSIALALHRAQLAYYSVDQIWVSIHSVIIFFRRET
jgi:hypothetical protein